MQNARLDEPQAGIKIARRNIHNLRYADNAILMAESEEKLRASCEVKWSEVKWVAQLRLTFCNPIDYTVHGVLSARILEWVAFPFSRESSQSREQTQVSCVADEFFTSWATKEAQVTKPEPKFALLENPLFCFKYLVSMVLLLYQRAFWICY